MCDSQKRVISKLAVLKVINYVKQTTFEKAKALYNHCIPFTHKNQLETYLFPVTIYYMKCDTSSGNL